jgi:hypothetical protein
MANYEAIITARLASCLVSNSAPVRNLAYQMPRSAVPALARAASYASGCRLVDKTAQGSLPYLLGLTFDRVSAAR